ncbi:response regulator transcription factor [Butyrivibrio sp. YAB3001]|uniref:response regulator transcription factor n=1 Tax=Butyrivibrio sp. YAB3001 TaxID=1520812 RepID=UPI0008F67D62|nr:response regulator [Butyrivibrio sp. YAB3001]SFB81871.1 Helix-turn-helix domain-containing protein [Butyrivibrio sp. YAB3001]
MDKYRILVADDEPIERQVVNKKIMSFFPEQVEVYLAENGLKAVQLYEEKSCQIAVLDIAMPGMNGLEAASVIRDRHPDAGIIFLTAFDEFSYAKKAIEVRALDYLLKPCSGEELINVLEEAFGHCDKKHENVSPSVEGEPADALLENNAFVKKVGEFIDSRFRDDIALQDIASAFGYSEVYFCKLFKQNFGKNFITYLNEYRLNKAKLLLADPMINIKDISNKAGFRDANYFTRVFKRMVGMTPSEYRSGAVGK